MLLKEKQLMDMEAKTREMKMEMQARLDTADHHKQTLANQLDKATKEIKQLRLEGLTN